MNASEILQKVIAELNRQPARTPVLVTTTTRQATRQSKGKADRAVIGGISSMGKDGYGIISKHLGKEQDYRGEWVIRQEVRPPQTDAEMLAVARAMYERWADQSLYRTVSSPDDERDRAAWDEAGRLNREIGTAVKALLA